jgi:hypothetical protein
MQRQKPLEPQLLGPWSIAWRWLASLTGAALTAVWVFDTTAGAHQLAWLMERARPACLHSSLSNEELHQVAEQQLAASPSKRDALRNVIGHCQANLRAERSQLRDRIAESNLDAAGEEAGRARVGVVSRKEPRSR